MRLFDYNRLSEPLGQPEVDVFIFLRQATISIVVQIKPAHAAPNA
jgi:hypothetical protein